VDYDGGKGRKLKADLYEPKADVVLHRGLVLIHGGGWVGGNRAEMGAIASALAKKGFTGFSIDYTLARTGTRWPTQLEDVQAAVRYFRSHATEYGIDPKEMAAAGVSAGGHLSLFLGVKDAPENGVSSQVQAVGSISGVLDLNLKMTPAGEPYRIVQQLLVDQGEPSEQAKRDASPVTFLTKTSPPTFLIQGKADPLVPENQSTETHDKLTQLGVSAEYRFVDGMGHRLIPSHPAEAKALDDFANWLKKILKASK
jgi:acetyl esterase/lipase